MPLARRQAGRSSEQRRSGAVLVGNVSAPRSPQLVDAGPDPSRPSGEQRGQLGQGVEDVDVRTGGADFLFG